MSKFWKPSLLLLLLLAVLGFLTLSLTRGKIPTNAEEEGAVAHSLKQEESAPTARDVPVPDESATASANSTQQGANVPRVNPSVRDLDALFKQLEAEPRLKRKVSDYEFLRETEIGERVRLKLKDSVLEGVVATAKNHGTAYQRVVDLDDGLGRAIVNVDGNNIFRTDILIEGDSRVIHIQRLRPSSDDLVGLTGDLSSVVCAPDGSVYQPNAGIPLASGGKLAPSRGTIAAAQPEFTTEGTSDHVIYIDFDGEPVSNTPWNNSTLTTIEAAAHPKANDVEWVQFIWNRVAEDFAAFDIIVTTDRDVYDSADPDKRVMAVVTPTSDWYPIRFPGEDEPGGVAFVGSFNDLDPVVWVFNFEEYSVADTISHEVGHAFKLSHDGRGTYDEYYGGHGPQTSEVSWAPIMGAPWSDEGITQSYNNVTQWSRGEYDDANNFEDDIGLIADTATGPPTASFLASDGPHGFGFKADDYANNIGNPGLGGFALINNTDVSANGIISTSNDVDLFVFDTVPGPVDLTVSPLDVMSDVGERGSNTMGANLAVRVQLMDASGTILSDVAPSDTLAANVSMEVTGGTYYLAVSGSGRLTASDGFTDYASLGSYSISGSIAAPPLSVFGGAKQDVEVTAGSTEASIENGTDLGFVVVGASQTNASRNRVFNLENSSDFPVTIVSADFDGGDAFDIINGPTTINPGGTATLTLRFTATSTGLYQDTLRLVYDSAFPEQLEASFAIQATGVVARYRDNYELNNSVPEAFDLNGLKNTWLSDYRGLAINGDVRDYYDLNASSDDVILTVEVETDAAAPANIAVSLHDSFGTQRSVMSFNNGVGLLRYAIPPTATNRYFYIKVLPLGEGDPDGFSYDLRWNSVQDEGDRSDDFYEENDTLDDAYDLTAQPVLRLTEILGEAIQADEDWYRFDVPRNPRLRLAQIECTFDSSLGDIDIALYGPSSELSTQPVLLERAASVTDNEFLSYFDYVPIEVLADQFFPVPFLGDVTGLYPGTYYVQVTSANGAPTNNTYDLNIELLEDDNYEISSEDTENDTRRNAYDLGFDILGRFLSSIDGLGVIADYASGADADNFPYNNDDDWYSFSVPDNVNSFSLTLRSGISGWVRAEITTATGRLLASGETPFDSTTFINGTDFVDGNLSDLDSFYSEIVLNVDEVEDTEYFFHVWGWDGTDPLNSYDFRVDVSFDPPPPPVGEADDNYEENDDYLNPYDLSSWDGTWLAAIDGYGILSDNDWFRIEIPQNASNLTVELVHNSADGNIDMTLFNSDEALAFREEFGIGSETIDWDNPKPGTYFIGLSGDYSGTPYNLRWKTTRSEDNYEENDSLSDADARFADNSGLILPERTWLSKVSGKGIQADDDWYRIEIGANISQLSIISDFNHQDGDIDVELYDSDGFIVGRSVSTTDDETLLLNTPASGVYYIRVYFGDAANEYDLYWQALTSSEVANIVEDSYEENDGLNEAFSLGSASHQFLSETSGPATMTDEDWYAITIGENSLGLNVEATFSHGEGDIDVELYDSQGSTIVGSYSEDDNETINYSASLPAGTYYLRFFGSLLGQSYDFYWADKIEDAYEPNDSFATAFDITGLRQIRLADTDVPTQGDDDWYSFDVVDENSILVIELEHDASDGEIYFELYDDNESLLIDDINSDDIKYLQYALPSAGTFYLRVFGADAFNTYDLFWNALPEDAFEENDVLDDAEDISNDEGLDIEGVVFDADWFTIDPSYGVVSVELTLDFVHAFGDTNVSVYDRLGNLIAASTGTTDGESLVVEVNPFEGATYVEVYGGDGDYGNPYTLSWVSLTRDIDEDNDTLETATDLTDFEGVPLSERGGFGTSTDEDWFSIQPTGSNLFIYARFDHDQGDIDIELWDQNGAFLERSISDTDDESISTLVTAGQTYYIRVFGETAGNPYDLVWNSYNSDDVYEENDTLGAASDLRSVEYQLQENLAQLDDDWYEIEVESGENLLLAEIAPLALVDEMVLELYTNGGVLVDSVATADGETRIETSSLASGVYYLRVSGKNIGGSYSLIWSSGTEDNYEDNDTLGDAFEIPLNELQPLTSLSTIDGPGAQYDEDWYSVTLTSDDSTLNALLAFENDEGDLSLALYDSLETELISSNGTLDTESLTINGLDAGVYYLRVNGPNNGTSYELSLGEYADDNYEDNDTFGDSYDLGSAVSGSLSAIDGLGVRGADDDYFSISVPPGYVTLDVTCVFAQADGNLSLELFDGAPSSLASSDTNTDNETVSVSVNPNGDTIYVLVSGAGGSAATYDLTWTFGLEDIYEDNNSTGTATDITGLADSLLSQSMGFATQTNSDFYLVTLPVNSRTLYVDVLFDHSLGDIDVNVYDSVPNAIAAAASTTDNESLSVPVSNAGGDYFIEVTGANSGNYYDLIWSVDVDDSYEENDDPTTTSDLTALDGSPLSSDLGLAKQFDEDWYSFSTPAGAIKLNVVVDGFVSLEGNIDIELYDASDVLLAASTGFGNSEEIEITLDPAGETFKVRVFGGDNGNEYDLLWSSSIIDVYEENDSVGDAYDLSAFEGVWLNTIDGLASQSDDDWYQIVVSNGATTLTVECDFVHSEGDIDLELYRLDPTPEDEKTFPDLDQRKPTLVARALSTTDNEEIVFDVTDAPGIYFIRVYFGNAGNLYDLRWDDALIDVEGDSDFLDEFWFFSEGANNLLDARLTTPQANSDNDAFPNWAEYALDLDIGISDTVVVETSTKQIGDETYFTVTFIRSSDAVARGYTFKVEECAYLEFDGGLAVEDSVDDGIGNGLERVTYRSSSSIEETSRCFFRISVEPPPKGY